MLRTETAEERSEVGGAVDVTLFAIGCEGRNIGGFVEDLLRHGVEILVYVRGRASYCRNGSSGCGETGGTWTTSF